MVAQLVMGRTEAGCRVKGAEAAHRVVSLLDAPMILLHPIVHIAAGAVLYVGSQGLADGTRVGVVPVRRHLLRRVAHHRARPLEEPFERSLDPAKRSQLGAHYTSRDDILLIVEPVLMAPLRRRWAAVQEEARALIGKRDAASGGARTRQQQALGRLLLAFTDEIAAVRVLDPACGSGNFLYVALKRLLDLWKEVSAFAAASGVAGLLPDTVGPQHLYGIEVNVYAHELASVVVWIGYIQWLHDNGFGIPEDPILKPLHNIKRQDAVLTYDEAGCPAEPAWPEADVIIGNPPFVGGNKVRQELGDTYVDNLFRLYQGRVPAFADFVCYWFERARALVETGRAQRVGLLATVSRHVRCA